jgi:hypothetical protein
MSEQQSHRSAKELLRHITGSFDENQDFLHQFARETYEEVIELINNAIDWARLIDKALMANHAMTFFQVHILMPQSYALHVDLLSGNLPMCFTELRLMEESLAKSFYADLLCPEDLFFQHKLIRLEAARKKLGKTITDIVQEVEEYTSVKGDFVSLWREISNEWVHSGGLADRVVNYISTYEDVPPWGLVLPMRYVENDVLDLRGLGQRIAIFRKISAELVQHFPASKPS